MQVLPLPQDHMSPSSGSSPVRQPLHSWRSLKQRGTVPRTVTEHTSPVYMALCTSEPCHGHFPRWSSPTLGHGMHVKEPLKPQLRVAVLTVCPNHDRDRETHVCMRYPSIVFPPMKRQERARTSPCDTGERWWVYIIFTCNPLNNPMRKMSLFPFYTCKTEAQRVWARS